MATALYLFSWRRSLKMSVAADEKALLFLENATQCDVCVCVCVCVRRNEEDGRGRLSNKQMQPLTVQSGNDAKVIAQQIRERHGALLIDDALRTYMCAESERERGRC